MSTDTLEEILHPQSIAVVGASGNPSVRFPGFATALLEHGYPGKIYFVNPKYSEILGRQAYHSLREIPSSIDYVISCVPASEVLGILEDCAAKGVKAIHLFTARFSETGRREAIELEQEILREAKKRGIRLIGPNCMGLYDPRQGIAFGYDLPKKSGATGLISQSGAIVPQLAGLASLRGVYFSKAISYGNAIDLNECDFLDYLAQDPETKIILMYIEGVKNGRRFFNTLCRAVSTKPVIIVKGGRGKSGTRAVASHTATLAGSLKIWETIVAQTGAIPAENLDEMVDLAVSFHFLPTITGRRVGVVVGTGGASVLAADACEEAGLDVIPLPKELRKELKSKNNPVWDWIGNPADMSTGMGDLNFRAGDMLQLMAKNPNFDLLISTMGAPYRGGQQESSVDEYLKPYQLIKNNLKPLLAVVADRSVGIDNYDSLTWQLTCEVRTKAVAAGIPFYPTIERAARAARKLAGYYQRRK